MSYLLEDIVQNKNTGDCGSKDHKGLIESNCKRLWCSSYPKIIKVGLWCNLIGGDFPLIESHVLQASRQKFGNVKDLTKGIRSRILRMEDK